MLRKLNLQNISWELKNLQKNMRTQKSAKKYVEKLKNLQKKLIENSKICNFFYWELKNLQKKYVEKTQKSAEAGCHNRLSIFTVCSFHNPNICSNMNIRFDSLRM